MSTRPRRRPASLPTLSPPYAASRTKARYRGRIESARMSTCWGVKNRISSRSIRGSFTESQGLVLIFPASTAVAKILLRVCAALTAMLGAIGRRFREVARQHSTKAADHYASGSRPRSGRPCVQSAPVPSGQRLAECNGPNIRNRAPSSTGEGQQSWLSMTRPTLQKGFGRPLDRPTRLWLDLRYSRRAKAVALRQASGTLTTGAGVCRRRPNLFCPPRVILRQEEPWARKWGRSGWELRSAVPP
jgi:hypothetical protein